MTSNTDRVTDRDTDRVGGDALGEDASTLVDQAPVDEALAEIAPLLIEQVNSGFEDSLTFTGRILGGVAEATAATLTGLDARGVDLSVTEPSGQRRVRLDFAEPLTDVTQASAAFHALVLTARQRSGEPGRTSIEQVFAQMTAVRTFLTAVARVRDIHPHLRCITFAGGDLETFEPLGPDTFLYVLLPPPGRVALTIDASFTWERVNEMPESERPVGAYYTVREWRPAAAGSAPAELDMLFVLHDPAGPATEWARRARPGDPVALWGPRDAYAPPPGTDWYLLVADDTGLPAAARIIETLPDGVPVTLVAEVDSVDEQPPVPTHAGLDVRWVHRHGTPAGTTSQLADAVRGLAVRDGAGYVWGGGESRVMTAVRRYVRNEIGLPRERVSLVAYWRHATSPVSGDTE